APYPHPWNSAPAAGGTHVLKATAKNGGGGSASASISVTVNNKPPTAIITAPMSGALLTGLVTVKGNATDAVGVTMVTFFDGTNMIGSAGSAPYNILWDTNQSTNGSHTLTMSATDVSGKTGVSSPVAVYVD